MTPPSDALAGRVALVTGASSGIGTATAEALAAEGASVVLVARRADRLLALAERIEDSGGAALVHAADVTDLDQLRAGVEAAKARFGPIDILVNNAGVMPLSSMSELRVDDWVQMVDVNVKGVLHGLAVVLPDMIERGSGHIVNVGSVAGRRPFPGGAVYSATKFAVRSLSWGLHLDLGSTHGIRVTDVQPGVVTTELLETIPDPARKAAFEQNWTERRALEPEDVARAILFAVTSPPHVSVSEVLVRPVDQPG